MTRKMVTGNGSRRPYLRGAPTLPRLAAVALGVVLAFVGLVVTPNPALAAAPLRVELSVDRTEIGIDLSPGQERAPATLRYEVLVENLGDDLVSGVELIDELPAGLVHPDGRTVRMTVGDLGARGLWRGQVDATVDPTALSGAVLTNQVVVTTAAGDRVESAPVRTSVLLISATSIVAPAEAAPQVAQPAPAPAPVAPPAARDASAPVRRSQASTRAATPPPRPRTQVLGAVFTRGPDGEVVESLAHTGLPLLPLTGLGLGLMALGAGLLRRGRV